MKGSKITPELLHVAHMALTPERDAHDQYHDWHSRLRAAAQSALEHAQGQDEVDADDLDGQLLAAADTMKQARKLIDDLRLVMFGAHGVLSYIASVVDKNGCSEKFFPGLAPGELADVNERMRTILVKTFDEEGLRRVRHRIAEWVPVQYGSPDEGVSVLVWCSSPRHPLDADAHIAFRRDGLWIRDDQAESVLRDVTHWMTLPASPDGDVHAFHDVSTSGLSPAPDLLVALKRAANAVAAASSHVPPTMNKQMELAWNAAQDAIAKAEGRKAGS